jgi:rhodanese-related sulfurtransferase
MMKKRVAVVGILAAFVLAACGSATSAVQTVDPQNFLASASQTGAVVVDVRTPEEFAAGHLPDAVNVNVEDPTFESQIASLDKGATYVVYCRSGRRSAVATDAMAAAGFTSVFNLNGGLDDLAAAGATVVTQ